MGPTHHRGRPRDPTRRDVLREAALDLVVEQGYDRVTIDAVAARAGAGKATVYRYWSSKAELVVDALADLPPAGELLDTGSLPGDLEQLCAALDADPDSRTFQVMQGLASAIGRDPELRAAFTAQVIAPRRAAMAAMLARAVARGEMPADKDTDLLTAVIPALILFRLSVDDQVPGPDFARHVIDQILLPAALSDVPTPTEPP